MELNHKLIFTGIIFFIISCTTNPIWENNNTKELNITGNVVAEFLSQDTPVIIWAETLDQLVTADWEGNFSISINSSQTPNGDLNGPLNIYFYIHNYILESAVINFTNGIFSNSQTDFTSGGELKTDIVLQKMVSGIVKVYPDSTILQSGDTLSVILSMETHKEVRILGYKKIEPHQNYLPSGVIFKSLNNDLVTIHGLSQHQLIPQELSSNEFISWKYEIVNDSLQLLPGYYQVTPFVLVEQDDFPEGFKNRISGNLLFTLGEQYLDLPIDFILDTLHVVDE